MQAVNPVPSLPFHSNIAVWVWLLNKITGGGAEITATFLAILSNVSSDFRCPLQDTVNGLGLQKAGDENLQKPASFTGISEKWKRNVSKIIHITYTIASSLLIALGELKQQPVKSKCPSGSLWFPDTLKKKRLCLYIIPTCQVLFGDIKRHCKYLNKSYYVLLWDMKNIKID